ncbi:hypothetical protein BGW42_001400 [Actinomortierella wolfii]|nr:hypothetical protein BGW42_001400 [Actinomortierella wolfii]
MQDAQFSQEHHPNYGSISISGTGSGTGVGGQPPASYSATASNATSHHQGSRPASTHPSSSAYNSQCQTPLSRSRRASDARSIATHSSDCSSASSSWSSSRTTDSLSSDEECDEECGLDTPTKGRRLFWSYIALAPILALVVVLFAVLLQLLLADNEHGHDHRVIFFDVFGIGMLGWGISFILRRPVFAIVSRGLHLDPFLCECITLLAAGVLDESVRLMLISMVVLGAHKNNNYAYYSDSHSPRIVTNGDGAVVASGEGSGNDGRHHYYFIEDENDFSKVYWLGLGWASIETMYYLGQSLVFSRWLTRDEAKDPEARYTVRQMLGIDLERTSPWWSVMGRVSSLMVHVGLSCWLGVLGLVVLPLAMAIHGSLYLVWGVLMPHRRWSVPATSYGTFMVAMTVFLIGLALYGEIV